MTGDFVVYGFSVTEQAAGGFFCGFFWILTSRERKKKRLVK